MPYPNSALNAWQLALIAVVAVGCLSVWLIAVYLAAREPRSGDHAAVTPPADAPGAGTGIAPLGAGEPEPPRRAA